MKKIEVIVLFILVLTVVALNQNSEEPVSLSPLGLEYHGNGLKKMYSEGERISGIVNISLSSADGSTELTSNFNGNISLIDLIKKSGFLIRRDYNCSTSDCTPDYSRGQVVQAVRINESSKTTIGFSLSGREVSSVQKVKLNISSNLQASCTPPIYVDFLSDGKEYATSDEPTNLPCAEVYRGCFTPRYSTDSVIISSNAVYCQNITLPPAPAYRLRANVKKSTQGERDLKMRLYDVDGGNYLSECILPQPTSDDYQSLGCTANHSSAYQQDYFVCITAGAGSNTADYKIKYETSTEDRICGTNNFQSFDVDYDITARSLEFANLDNWDVDGAFSQSYDEELRVKVADYVADRYGGECVNGCSIPIDIFGKTQEIVFSNIQLIYSASQGNVETNNLYRLELKPAKISSGKLGVDISKADFIIPLNTNERSFKLYYGGQLVFEQQLNISRSFSFDVSPKFASFGQEIHFAANASGNITRSVWKFGDGTNASINGKEIKHRYLEQGEFELEVTLQRGDGLNATRTFQILIGDARVIGNKTIQDYKNRIINLTRDINGLESWLSEDIVNGIGIVDLNNSLKDLERRYGLANNDTEYERIMMDLIALRIPKNVKITQSGESLLVAGIDDVDVSHIESISSSSSGNEEELRRRITGWMNDNTDAKLTLQKIDALYDSNTETIITKFKVETKPKKNFGTDSYLVIGKAVNQEGKYKTDYGQREVVVEGYSHIPLNGQNSQTFEFYLKGDYNPQEIGAYISPILSRLGEFDTEVLCVADNYCDKNSGENNSNCPVDCKKFRWGLFIFMTLGLLFVAFAIYILLQEWYKRNYENHLFKDKNDLYNLINFIYNSRKAGLSDKQSRAKLSETGWSWEQVSFAFKKIDGKRTGMYEIPLFKGRENKKVLQELQRRQKNQIDARFIKRRDF